MPVFKERAAAETHAVTDACDWGSLQRTAIDILTIAVLAGKAARLVAQGSDFARRQFGLVLEVAKFALVTAASEMPVIAHFLATLLHAHFERLCSYIVLGWKRQVESLSGFIVIGIFFGCSFFAGAST